MSTNHLAERLREVIRAGLVQDARAWCEAAGLSGGFLSSFFVRAKHKPDASISADNATALASVAGVRPAWLLTGEGPRERRETTELASGLDPRIAEIGATIGAPAHVIQAAHDLRAARGSGTRQGLRGRAFPQWTLHWRRAARARACACVSHLFRAMS